MVFRYSDKRRPRRQQKAYIRRSFGHLPDPVAAFVKGLPVTVVFRPWIDPSGKVRSDVCIYDTPTRTIHVPTQFWKDQATSARWIRRLNEATFLHESGHAVDMIHLTPTARDGLLGPLTGFPANGHAAYPTGRYPVHADAQGVVRAQWFSPDWGQSAAELFADTFVAAYTALPPHDRAPQALQVTPEGIEAVRTTLGPTL